MNVRDEPTDGLCRTCHATGRTEREGIAL